MTVKQNQPPRPPVRSMTGFARIAGDVPSAAAAPHATFTLTLKSVNHRFLDLQLRLPGNLDSLEMQLRRLLKDNIARGHLEVTLTYEPAVATEPLGYDRELVTRYLAAFRELQQEYELKQEPDLNAILRLPGVFRSPGNPGNIHNASARRAELQDARQEAMDALEAAVLAHLPQALDALNAMRETEGAALVAVLVDSLARLERDVHAASELRTHIQPSHFERLQLRMRELLLTANGANGAAIDSDRLLQEAALLADRSDIEEELVRLRMHAEHFRSLLREGGEVGKKLDFLLQEMNREANTLLSKSAGMGDEGSRLTVLGLAMKSEIEKAREQIQNLE